VSQIPFILRGDEKNPHFCILDKKIEQFQNHHLDKKIITKLQILNYQQFQIKALVHWWSLPQQSWMVVMVARAGLGLATLGNITITKVIPYVWKVLQKWHDIFMFG
jgi:hypothetical protein